MKKRIFIPGTIVIVIIVLLGFFTGCVLVPSPFEVHHPPPAAKDYLGTWLLHQSSDTMRIEIIFTNTWFYESISDLKGGFWYSRQTSRGPFTASGDQITWTLDEINYDGWNWEDIDSPTTSTYTYSISDNELTLKTGDVIDGVYTKI